MGRSGDGKWKILWGWPNLVSRNQRTLWSSNEKKKIIHIIDFRATLARRHSSLFGETRRKQLPKQHFQKIPDKAPTSYIHWNWFVHDHSKGWNVTNTRNGERGTGNGERGTGNGERGTGNGERGTGNGEPQTEVWERVYSGNPPENLKWRTKEKKEGSVTVVKVSFYRLCTQMTVRSCYSRARWLVCSVFPSKI